MHSLEPLLSLSLYLQALIPYYCRLVAALAKIYPDLGTECAQIFRAEFFRLLRRAHDSGTRGGFEVDGTNSTLKK
jgi:hypothetical protein